MSLTNAEQAPSQDREAEESTLGAALVNDAAADAVVRSVVTEDFYFERHRVILHAIAELRERGEPADALTVTNVLKGRRKLTAAGGRDYVSKLASGSPAPSNAAHYAAIVRDLAAERAKCAIGHKLTNDLPPAEAIEALRAIEAPRSGLQARPVDLGRVRPTRWAWERRLPLGYLALLLGAEGVGKGALAVWILARLTRGELPGDLAGQPARVLLVGDEDAFDSVIVPRLYVAGADLALVDTLTDDGDQLELSRDAGRLRDLLREGEHRLFYIDALLDTLGVDVDDWRSKAVRDALRPLRRVARELDVCALGSLHPNKGQRGSFRDLVSGSHAFNASSRSSLLLASHPDDEDRRVLVRGKGNLSVAPPSFEFAIHGREEEINGHGFNLPIVADIREGDLDIEDVVKPTREAPVRETLADRIDALGTGEVKTRAEIARALGREPSDASVGRALSQLEDQDRWQKVGRGKWQRIVIATSREVAMSNVSAEESVATPEEEERAARLLDDDGGVG